MDSATNKLLFTLSSLLSLSSTPLNPVILSHPPVSPQKDQVRLMVALLLSLPQAVEGAQPVNAFISEMGVSSVVVSLVSGLQPLP